VAGQRRLLAGLPQRAGDRVLMAVARPAGQPPRAAVVAPHRALLHQHVRHPVVVVVHDEQPGGAVQPPVAVSSRALRPAVAVLVSHVVILSSPPLSPNARSPTSPALMRISAPTCVNTAGARSR